MRKITPDLDPDSGFGSDVAARVFLCWQVGRFGFAFDSPQRRVGLSRTASSNFILTESGDRHSLQIRQTVLRVRILLAPPASLRLQRLCTRYPRPSQKLPRFRGVLGEGHSRIRTGDGEFRADSGQLVAFISVAKFGGSDSLPIRPTGNTGGSNSIRSAI